MTVELLNSEIKLLNDAGIDFSEGKDISAERAEEILDKVRDLEVKYSQDADVDAKAHELAVAYGDIADKIQDAIDKD